jgi:hypothetical protein
MREIGGVRVPGVSAAGFKNTGCVPASDLNAPSGLIISALFVPSSTAGSGVSFEVPTSGPVITGTLDMDGDLYRNGAVIDANFNFTFSKASFVYDYKPPFAAQGGFKHLIMNWYENNAFAAGVALTPGNYEFRLKITDYVNATSQSIKFVVT